MSLMFHILNSQIDFFPNNMGLIKDEHGDRCHQQIFGMESRYRFEEKASLLTNVGSSKEETVNININGKIIANVLTLIHSSCVQLIKGV